MHYVYVAFHWIKRVELHIESHFYWGCRLTKFTDNEQAEIFEVLYPAKPWVEPEMENLMLRVKVVIRDAARKVYGRNLSKMFEALIVKQMREDNFLPPAGAMLPSPGESVKTTEKATKPPQVLQPEVPNPYTDKRRIVKVSPKKK